ncbi:MAG: hypothetical protein ACYC6A_06630 [Armatimonadota bacterium]
MPVPVVVLLDQVTVLMAVRLADQQDDAGDQQREREEKLKRLFGVVS